MVELIEVLRGNVLKSGDHAYSVARELLDCSNGGSASR
jgi:hypothetical protein